MAVRSRFTPRVPQAPTGRKLSVQVVKDMRGLNSTDPYGILPTSASPYLRNVRMYLSDTNRQVAISTRNGAIEYSTPIGEAERFANTTTAGAAVTHITSTRWIAYPFTVSQAGVLTKIDVKVGKDSGIAPLNVRIHEDNSGEPGAILAKSTISNSNIDASPDYSSCRFVEAPPVATSTTYWLVISVQRADDSQYQLSTTTDSTDALLSTTSGNTWVAQSFSINARVYVSNNSGVKGATRFYPSTGTPTTFFAHGTNIYSINDNTGATTSRKSGLSASTEIVRYAQFDNALFAANGYNPLQRSTGTTFADVTELSTTPSNVTAHKNRLWVVSATDPNRLEFSELAEYDNWESTAFIYVPEPKSDDPIVGLTSFQDTLVVHTKNNKYVVYGDDLATFEVRQSLGTQGAISQEAIVADENYVYFISGNGHLYRWNGSRDEQLSRPIEADLDDIANTEDSRLTLWKDRVYYWFKSTGQTDYNNSFVYETRFNEWFYDTGRFINGGIPLIKEDDKCYFTSGRAGVLYQSALTYSDVGRPIDFEYHTNYFDFGSPDNFKQVRRLYLQFRKVAGPGPISVGTDVDFKNDPLYEEIDLQAQGAIWGTFVWNDGFVWGSADQYERIRLTVPGQATHYQVRVKKTCSEQPVYFIGHSEHYRSRRAA